MFFYITKFRAWIADNVILHTIILISILLRIRDLNQPYIDMFGWRQSSVAMMAQNYFKVNANIFYPAVNWGGAGPGYNGREFQTVSYLAAILYRIFGQHDCIGRLVAIVFSVWGIYAFYRLIKKLGNVNVALGSALLLGIFPLSLRVDRCFLPDPAMVAMVITGLWMLITYLETLKMRYFLLAIFAICLGFLTKITGMLTGLCMVYAIISITKAKRKLVWANLWPIFGASLFILLVVTGYYLWARYLSMHYPPFHFAGSGNWLWDDELESWINKNYFIETNMYLAKYYMWGSIFLLVGIVGLISSCVLNAIKGREDTGMESDGRPKWLMHFWLIGCLFFYFIGAKELEKNCQNFNIFTPVVAYFSALGLHTICSFKSKSENTTVIRLLVVFSISLLYSRSIFLKLNDSYYSSEFKMGRALSEMVNAKDLVISLGTDVGNPVAIYYSGVKGWVFPPARPDYDWGNLPENSLDAIEMLNEMQRDGAIWFGITQPSFIELEKRLPEFVSYLGRHFKQQQKNDEFIIYRVKNNTE